MSKICMEDLFNIIVLIKYICLDVFGVYKNVCTDNSAAKW